MKTTHFILVSILTIASAQAVSDSELCKKKKTQYGTSFISCSEVDWGVKPISADYQQANVGPMTAPPSELTTKDPNDETKKIQVYNNDYKGIKNTEFFFNNNFEPKYPNTKGLPLASKFYSTVSNDEATMQKDPKLAPWLGGEWFNSLKQKDAGNWEGKCATWSAWSMDPELQKLFSGMRDGILCGVYNAEGTKIDYPFTKGELKELVTSLYPQPSMDWKHFDKFVAESVLISPDEMEDANVALSKLGVLGQGDMQPSDLIAMAQSAKADGKNMMMDRDPGSETWNQPIQKITDVAYSDSSMSEMKSLSSADFSGAAVSDLADLEASIMRNALVADLMPNDRFCLLRTKLGEECENFKKSKLSSTQQVDELNRLKQLAYDKKQIQKKQNIVLEKHELIIEYGVENPFASSAPDKTVIQSYTYSSVHQKNTDGSAGALIRSNWSPKTSALKDICANQSVAEGRNLCSLTRGFKINEKCANGKPVDQNLSSHEYFTSAVPPHEFKTFRATPQFDVTQATQKAAYQKLLDYMRSCPTFDAGVDFLKHLDEAALNNVISPQETSNLTNEYANVKNLLDTAYIKSLLDNKYQGVQGVAALKSSLKL